MAETWGGENPAFFPLTRGEPVGEGDNRRIPLNWNPLPYSVLRELNKALKENGLQSTYFSGMIEGIANGYKMLPQDWKDLMRMLVSPAQYVVWDSEFKAAALAGATAAVTAEQAYGAGAFAGIEAQMQLTDDHILATWLCISRALKRVPNAGKPLKSFSAIKQGHDEPYTGFIDRLKDAIFRQLDNIEAQAELLKKLGYENANTECKKVLQQVIHRQGYELADMITACVDIGSKTHEMSLLAAAMQRGRNGQNSGRKTGTCFNCKKYGHFKNECRAPGGGAYKGGGQNGGNNKPSKKCPKCHKGYHWGNQCRSQQAEEKSGN